MKRASKVAKLNFYIYGIIVSSMLATAATHHFFSYAIIVKIIGWIGSVSYVAAYLLLSMNKIRSDKNVYHILNIIGAVGLIFDALYLNDYPNLAINVIWALIAFLAIYLIWKKKSS